MRRTVVTAVLLLALAAPAAGLAQGSPFAPLPPAPAPAPEPVQGPENTFGNADDGMDPWQMLVIFGGALALLAGISFAILGDARRRAPTEERRSPRPAGVTGDGRDKGGPPSNVKARQKARQREAAKRARRARKANR